MSKQIKNHSALFYASNEQFNKVYYFSSGRHNQQCTTHCKEECWAENLHLRPSRKERKQKYFNPSAHLSVASALITSSLSPKENLNDLVVDWSATHHMFNNKDFFH
ncbi:hypothetical protein O181_012025 [Austropuccinia psidii MF-1]|uniref:Uncharacterized protein n=1 Tax=Austropuccinia psidii MF-1 TaxID=1389203 RepID=A0A9Q3BWA2_9BASI|nr:hypothetical protein [Austropuccinia psidii MF-1]